jgi:hypothetical protein
MSFLVLGLLVLNLLGSFASASQNNDTITFLYGTGIRKPIPEGQPGQCQYEGEWLARLHRSNSLLKLFRRIPFLKKNDPNTFGFRDKVSGFLHKGIVRERINTLIAPGIQNLATPVLSEPSHHDGILNQAFKWVGPCGLSWLPLHGGFQHSQTKLLGEIQIMEPFGDSIISDIDDTIRLSNAHSVPRVLYSTFLNAFEQVRDMKKLYDEWNRLFVPASVAWHYVSDSPMGLQLPLTQFVADFPKGSIMLKQHSIFSFDKRSKHKKHTISKLFHEFPSRRYWIIGDSGTGDPVVFPQLYREWVPKGINISCIFIRHLGDAPKDPQGLRKLYKDNFKGVADQHWKIYSSPAEIESALPNMIKTGTC